MSEHSGNPMIGINRLFIAVAIAIVGLAIGLSEGVPILGAVGGVVVGGIMLAVFSRWAKMHDQ
ncbi:MAG: hypothetical protein DHS20C11_09210 [Lysobacteraceae bacterium]|nr:MAG: hypothetical protein DHS20C11_09210 [Xanthomonadaceae bacterium]